MTYTKIIGTGSYMPKIRLTNECLQQIVDTSDDWIMQRVGVKTRPIAWPWETPSVLSTKAAQNAIKSAKIDPKTIDLLIVATVKGDFHFPSCACQVQHNIGATSAYAYDLNAGCTGFIYALDQADSGIKVGKIKTALIIGMEKLSDVTDYTDRSTCVLFGDGAGAVVLQATTEQRGIVATYLRSDGAYKDMLWCTNEKDGNHFLKMEGKPLLKKAINYMVEAANMTLEQTSYKTQDLDWVIPHQANHRIVTGTGKKLGIEEKVILRIRNIANISSATIPIVLDQLNHEKKLKENDLILFDAFGAGLTWGAVLVKW